MNEKRQTKLLSSPSSSPSQNTLAADRNDEIAVLRPRVMKKAMYLTGNQFDADDVAQNALIKAIERHNYPVSNLGGWLNVIAFTVYNNAQRYIHEVPTDPVVLNELVGSVEPDQFHAVYVKEIIAQYPAFADMEHEEDPKTLENERRARWRAENKEHCRAQRREYYLERKERNA